MQPNGQHDREDTIEQVSRQLAAIASRLERIEMTRRTVRKAKAGHRDIEPSVESLIEELGSVTLRDVVERLAVTHKTAYLAVRAVAFHGGGRLELEPHGKSLRLRLYHPSQPSATRLTANH